MKIEVYEDASNKWRWRAVDSNGRIIADGAEGYQSEANVKRALVNVLGEFRKVTGYLAPDGTRVQFDENI